MPKVAGSKYFEWSEFSVSHSHPELVEPVPEELRGNVETLVRDILDPMRRILGRPIHILSCYRSEALNKAVGGSPTSQHRNASAADFTTLRIRSVFESMMGRVPQFPVGQVIFYPEQHFIHCALPSKRHTVPAYYLHLPKIGYVYHRLASLDAFRKIMERL